MKAPSLISDEAKKKSDADLAKAVAETAKHPAGVKALSADDAKAVVMYIRSLQNSKAATMALAVPLRAPLLSRQLSCVG